MSRRAPRRILASLGFALALLTVAWAAYEVAERFGVSALSQNTAHRFELYSSSLQNELRRNEHLPTLVSLNADVKALMLKPQDAALRFQVNRYLQTVSERTGVAAIYVMNRQGLTLAASNWNQAVSFIDMNFAYRPYFQQALMGQPGRFYGIGTVSREAGFYFARGIERGDQIEGVVAVKVNLDKLDSSWQQPGEKVLVADGSGVVFLASEPAWKFKTVGPLSPDTLKRLEATRQYTEAGALAPLGLIEQEVFQDGTSLVNFVDARDDGPPHYTTMGRASYLSRRQPIPGTDWFLYVFSETAYSRVLAEICAAVAALTFTLSVVVFLYFLQRRRFMRDELLAKAALQRANDELEEKVELRTEDLLDANSQLQTEITERKRAEETLKATLDELVHAAKMAALGKIATGITHELNQPLAALRTLSANTRVFMERGDQATAESNLEMIEHLAEHMGKITSQLKRFARKSLAESRPINVVTAMNNAAFLLAQVTRERQTEISLQSESEVLLALCDSNRLEQVLVNLLSNALDAVARCDHRLIEVRAHRENEGVTLEVHDSGEGLSEQAIQHLFEPFFTTKEQGAGLGLGLAISADILREFGGILTATSSPLGGAMFIINLPGANLSRDEALHV
ncbi:ATP-binding protein [Curvibacter sp. HBC28]|uniref:histidine kinase n=1 Tax=Curvibacter microcysteis TaxID=3026419 RepID=A0ABT5MJ10_9BURK|nr:ATP-binding protein [Curvibacter sp. HBC28]MDD0815882.1 ATP-binding protein [Curvibacter sp. HBC28]